MLLSTREATEVPAVFIHVLGEHLKMNVHHKFTVFLFSLIFALEDQHLQKHLRSGFSFNSI